jgi:arginyl-tRNA synthetase
MPKKSKKKKRHARISRKRPGKARKKVPRKVHARVHVKAHRAVRPHVKHAKKTLIKRPRAKKAHPRRHAKPAKRKVRIISHRRKKHARKPARKAPAKKPVRRRHAKKPQRPAPAKPLPVIHSADFIRSIKAEISGAVASASGLNAQDMVPLLERPPEGIDADFALPCFTLSRQFRKAPQAIAQELAGKIKPAGMIKQAKPAGPYLNFSVDWNLVAAGLLPAILGNSRYGSSGMGKGKTIVVDFSSPNTAKPIGVGHLRSTTIGDSLCRMHRFLGYEVVGDNHLGDWGTQFGKMIVAYRKWGHPEKLDKNPVEEMFRLYTKFHEEAGIDEALDEQARLAFKKLEDGDKEYVALWKRLTELSNREFQKIYRLLGVRFDLWLGESFYDRMAKDVIAEALRKKVAKWSQHALIIEVGGQVPLIIRKSDEATTYATRDLAAIKYRLAKFRPEKILYVVGSEQKSYLEQAFAAAGRLGYVRPGQSPLVHVNFGMMSLPEGRMSTRKGRIVMLDHVIKEVTDLADKTIIIKNPGLRNRKRVAQEVGVGALKYADLSRDRIKDIKFDWDEILSFEGDTGPYIQYTHARACSILRKGNLGKKASLDAFQKKVSKSRIDMGLLKDPKEKAIIRRLAEFPETVIRASQDCKPHYIANYVYTLATLFNEFYQSVPVLKAKKEKEARLALVFSVKAVLKSGLGLLGMGAPGEM